MIRNVVFKRLATAALLVMASLALSQAPASADGYRHWSTLYDNLNDKYLTIYVNPEDAKKHDGWCYVPGDEHKRKHHWSCTISEPRSNEYYQFPHVAEGTKALINGTIHRATLSAPRDGRLPYCVPVGLSRTQNDHGKNYYCAYWIPQ